MSFETKIPKFPWIDPTPYIANGTVVKESVYYAIKNESSHKSIACCTPIHSKGLEHIDGHDWELYRSSHRGIVAGVEYVWGMYVEGIGAFHMMAAIENTRRLTPAESEYYTNRRFSMVGSHTGKHSYDFNLGKVE